jgi:hypothetical protein
VCVHRGDRLHAVRALAHHIGIGFRLQQLADARSRGRLTIDDQDAQAAHGVLLDAGAPQRVRCAWWPGDGLLAAVKRARDSRLAPPYE